METPKKMQRFQQTMVVKIPDILESNMINQNTALFLIYEENAKALTSLDLSLLYKSANS